MSEKIDVLWWSESKSCGYEENTRKTISLKPHTRTSSTGRASLHFEGCYRVHIDLNSAFSTLCENGGVKHIESAAISTGGFDTQYACREASNTVSDEIGEWKQGRHLPYLYRIRSTHPPSLTRIPAYGVDVRLSFRASLRHRSRR